MHVIISKLVFFHSHCIPCDIIIHRIDAMEIRIVDTCSRNVAKVQVRHLYKCLHIVH